MNTPVLRRAIRNETGLYITDPKRGLPYRQVSQWEESASISAGFSEKGTLYKYRKGAAANISTANTSAS